MNKVDSVQQDTLYPFYEIWDDEFVDIACEECAVEFAKERGLTWAGGTSYESYTEGVEGKNVGASCPPSYAEGESDYPHTCCGKYLRTTLTPEGVEYLKDFPKWVQDLYLDYQ